MYGTLKKKYGQNFLIDKNILKKICSLIPNKKLNILEIGPGDGRLTEHILRFEPSNLSIVEIDTELILDSVYDGLSIQIKSLRSLKNITNIEGEEWKNKSFELTLNYVLNSLL